MSRYKSSISISTITSLSLVCFIIGLVFVFLALWPDFSNRIKENIDFTIYLQNKEDFSNHEDYKVWRTDLSDYLSKSPLVKDSIVNFKSRNEASIDFQNNIGEDFTTILDGFNPLLSHFDINLYAEFVSSKGADSMKNYIRKFNHSQIIHEFSYDKILIQNIDNSINTINIILVIFSLILIIVSYGIINNTIQLSIYSKKMLIRTMRLVGATNLFIQRPYLKDGMYQGLIGGIFSVILLILSIETLQWFAPNIIEPQDFFKIGVIFVSIIIFGIIIAWISTLFAVKKYLSTNENELFN